MIVTHNMVVWPCLGRHFHMNMSIGQTRSTLAMAMAMAPSRVQYSIHHVWIIMTEFLSIGRALAIKLLYVCLSIRREKMPMSVGCFVGFR